VSRAVLHGGGFRGVRLVLRLGPAELPGSISLLLVFVYLSMRPPSLQDRQTLSMLHGSCYTEA
jgi:hypothetical protein